MLAGLALWALVVFLAFYFFAATRFVLLVALATAVLAAALQPVADRLPGPRGVRAVCALLLLVLVVVGAIALLSWALYRPLQESVKEFPETRAQIDEVLSQWASRLGLEVQSAVDNLAAIAGRLFTGDAALGMVADVASAVLTTAVAILVVLVGTMYLLTRPPGSLSGAAIELLPR